MTEVVAMSDGGGGDGQTVTDTQHLIRDNSRWMKLKRNRYKVLGVGLTVIVLVSCIVAVVVTLPGSSSTQQHSLTANHLANIELSQSETRSELGYRLQVWGNFSSFAGDDFDMQCGAQYAAELGAKADTMVLTLNTLIGDQLCSNLVDEVVVMSNSNSLTTSGPNGQAWVAFILKVDHVLRFEDVYECGAEITIYLLDHDNWGNPLLPPIEGCPFPVFDPPRFYDDGSEWICSKTVQEKRSSVSANTPNVPQYDFTIDSNFTTVNGEDLSAQCGDDYMRELEKKSDQMFQELNMRLGTSLCEGTTLTIAAWNSMLPYEGPQGLGSVTYGLQSDVNHRMEEVFECTDDILPYVLDHANWGIPLLPQLPGCPLLVFHEDKFWDEAQRWNCDESSQT